MEILGCTDAERCKSALCLLCGDVERKKQEKWLLKIGDKIRQKAV